MGIVDVIIQIVESANSGKINNDSIINIKKSLYKNLTTLIDHRINLVMDERRKSVSQERVAIADTINSTVKSTASTLRGISALNSAPMPPEDISDDEEMKKWKSAYKEWYDTKRKEGISIK